MIDVVYELVLGAIGVVLILFAIPLVMWVGVHLIEWSAAVYWFIRGEEMPKMLGSVEQRLADEQRADERKRPPDGVTNEQRAEQEALWREVQHRFGE